MSDDNGEHGYDLGDGPKDVPDDREVWRSCFVIGIDTNGIAHMSPDPGEFVNNKVFLGTATPSDVWLATTQVKKDLEEISIAQRVLFNMQMLGQAMAQQVEADQIMRATGLQKPPFTP